jgi:hypothetical protein
VLDELRRQDWAPRSVRRERMHGHEDALLLMDA